MQFHLITYGMACKNDSSPSYTNIVKIYVYMRASLDFKFFYITKVAISFNMDGRNNHLQINTLKHILRMHKHDFCGDQSIYTRAILAK